MQEINIEEIKETDVYFLSLMQEIIKKLNLLDELIATNGQRQSKTDGLLSDFDHILENNDLTNDQLKLLMKKRKDARILRRHQKNEFELIRAYIDNKEKLSSQTNRQFLIAEIYKCWTRLNQKYNMRVLTKEEASVFDTVRTKKVEIKKKSLRLRSKESIELDNQIWNLYKERKSQPQIAEIVGISQPSVSLRLKRLKEEKETLDDESI